MSQLFGTDGIRGRANRYPITCGIAMKTGRAVGDFVRQSGFSRLVIGKDTRISGDMLEAGIAAGAASAGVDVILAGVIPTPGVAFLCTCLEGVGAGIVISASHNPYCDNGIKIFRQGGIKLTDDQEESIEAAILNPADPLAEAPSEKIGRIQPLPDSLEQYASFLKSKFSFMTSQEGPAFPKLKIVLDASNGAASKMVHLVFPPDRFDAAIIHDAPDGYNINDNCGSQHTGDLEKTVMETGAAIGLAFDGDADRLIAVDETGTTISGDQILAICAKFAKENNRLKNNILVSTIMSNVGLTRALDALGIVHLKSGVGDRKVLEEMIRSQAVIGGEDSGHMIFLEEHSTGDGMLSALKLIEVMLDTQTPLSGLAGVMEVFPQVLINVPVDASRPDFMQIAPIAATIRQVESELGDQGRVLIRYSGTQPLLRVMVEGSDQGQTQALCEKICASIRAHI